MALKTFQVIANKNKVINQDPSLSVREKHSKSKKLTIKGC